MKKARKRYFVKSKSLGVTVMGAWGAIVLTDKMTQVKLKELFDKGCKAIVHE
jgi:hypothetical protein